MNLSLATRRRIAKALCTERPKYSRVRFASDGAVTAMRLPEYLSPSDIRAGSRKRRVFVGWDCDLGVEYGIHNA